MVVEKLRAFCFTLNNWTQEEYDNIKLKVEPLARYLIIGKEMGESGTPHLQGYCQLIGQKTFGVVKSLIPRAHIEKTISTPDNNRTYCSKEGDYYEFGELKTVRTGGATTKATWERCKQLAIEGKFQEIDADLWIRYYGGFLKTHSMFRKRPANIDTIDNLWIHGEPGVGKSHYARTLSDDYFVKPHNKWWDGYNNEPMVILDDVDRSHVSWIGSFIKIWCDRYPFNAEVKGGSICIRPQRIVITSNYTIEELFANDNMLYLAISRRFIVKHFTISDRL